MRAADGAGDRDEFDSFSRVARLHPGLAVVAVVEHRDCQVRWPLHCDRRERTKPISISPSPVTTRTRRSGWAIASPSLLPTPSRRPVERGVALPSARCSGPAVPLFAVVAIECGKRRFDPS